MTLMRHFQRHVLFDISLLDSKFLCVILLVCSRTDFHSYYVLKEAYRKNIESGSTATVILLADGQILVANIGDSKAFLCSEKFHSPAEAKGFEV